MRMRPHTYYHRTLRSAAVITALVLIFDSGLVQPETKTLSDSAYQYLANTVGVMAVVPPNELNTITAELTARSQELDQRERDIEARVRDQGGMSDTSTYVLSSILFILLVLIVINYALDFYRYRRREVGVVSPLT